MNNDKITELATTLEGVLRNYLNCHYTDFGIKANDNLINNDWKSPVYFSLGHKYAMSNNSPEIKRKIDDFLGNDFIGKNIKDIIDNYSYYDFEDTTEAYNHIEYIIDSLKKILSL